jgi:hypothetical protein
MYLPPYTQTVLAHKLSFPPYRFIAVNTSVFITSASTPRVPAGFSIEKPCGDVPFLNGKVDPAKNKINSAEMK